MTSINTEVTALLNDVLKDPNSLNSNGLVKAYNLAAEITGDKHVNKFADKVTAMKRTTAQAQKALAKLAEQPVEEPKEELTADDVPAFLRKDAVVSNTPAPDADAEWEQAKPEGAAAQSNPAPAQAQPSVTVKPKVKMPPSAARDAYWASEAGQAHILKLKAASEKRRLEALERREAAKAARKAERDAAKAAAAKAKK